MVVKLIVQELTSIPGYDGRYSITENGKIWSHIFKGGGWLKTTNYRRNTRKETVMLTDAEGKQKQWRIKVLLEITFHPTWKEVVKK